MTFYSAALPHSNLVNTLVSNHRHPHSSSILLSTFFPFFYIIHAQRHTLPNDVTILHLSELLLEKCRIVATYRTRVAFQLSTDIRASLLFFESSHSFLIPSTWNFSFDKINPFCDFTRTTASSNGRLPIHEIRYKFDEWK